MAVNTVDLTAEQFINKTTLIYGVSGSGKTYLTQYLCYLLHNHIPWVTVICPTDGNNQAYTPLVTKHFVARDITEEHLSAIVATQIEKTNMYNLGRNTNLLRQCIGKLMAAKGRLHPPAALTTNDVNEVIKLDEFTKKLVKLRQRLDNRQYQEQFKILEDAKLRTFQNILRKRRVLPEIKSELTDKEFACIRAIGMNPRIMLVFDDYSEQLKALSKKKTVQQLFFTGRHMHITMIILVHGVTGLLEKVLRQNAHNSILMTAPMLDAFIRVEGKKSQWCDADGHPTAVIDANLFKKRHFILYDNDTGIFAKSTARSFPSFDYYNFNDPVFAKYMQALTGE